MKTFSRIYYTKLELINSAHTKVHRKKNSLCNCVSSHRNGEKQTETIKTKLQVKMCFLIFHKKKKKAPFYECATPKDGIQMQHLQILCLRYFEISNLNNLLSLHFPIFQKLKLEIYFLM